MMNIRVTRVIILNCGEDEEEEEEEEEKNKRDNEVHCVTHQLL